MQCRSTSTFRSYLQTFQTEMQVSECKKLSMVIFHHSLQPCWRYFRGSQIDASTYRAMKFLLHQSTAASTWWCGPGPRLGWVEMAVGLPKGSRYPGHSLSFFRFAAPWTTAEGQHTASSKSVACFLFIFSPALLRLLILLLLLMSGNVHPNPAPIFPCSVCAENVTWHGKSVQCCTCSKWVHLRCSQLSLSKFRALGSSHSWSCPPLRNTVTLSSNSSDMYTSTVQSGPPLLMLHSRPTLVFKPPIPHLPILYFLSLPLHHRPLIMAVLLRLLLPPPPDSLRVLQWNAGGLHYFTFFRPILLTLSASRNPILTPLPLSRFLYSLLCVLIAPTPGLAFSLLMPRTLLAVSSFSSGRAYPFQNFLPPLFLRLIHTLIM